MEVGTSEGCSSLSQCSLHKNSAYQHVFLTNGEKIYRLIVWKEKLDEAGCSSFRGKVELFFFSDQDVVPTQLHALFQFVCISDSKLTVLLKKPMVEYPEANIFPPFWKLIKQLALNDSEIETRAIDVVDKPQRRTVRHKPLPFTKLLLLFLQFLFWHLEGCAPPGFVPSQDPDKRFSWTNTDVVEKLKQLKTRKWKPKMSMRTSICSITRSYSGHSNLPDNLKQLFRSLAMTQPDRKLIAEVMLFSQGFQTAETLAKKIVSLFTLCKEQLSDQYHYDFGLRALKYVLVSAGNIKRAEIQRITKDQHDKGTESQERDIASRLPEQQILTICL
uniref:Dynein heavy chain hydrolytic ATP-binding dynein motor region domain-containing protein n=1 Tax=Ditylenchus dipsaci TaxID=166011 RepID=A0A915E747_9BILA